MAFQQSLFPSDPNAWWTRSRERQTAMLTRLNETRAFLETRLAGVRPDLAIIAGSGLGGLATALTQPLRIPYAEIPHFPTPGVAGHAGEMIGGQLAGKPVLVLSGRVHVYEGRPLEDVVYGVNTLSALGIKLLVVTNAAGGINRRYNPGDLMIIEDHLNFLGVNPLTDAALEDGRSRFIDLSQAYSARLNEKLAAAAAACEIPIWRGIYLANRGPSYETPAEIKAFAWLGADAVGMSTVPEVIMARYHNIEVAGLSCITNLAAGIGGKKLNHDEVLETGRAVQDKMLRLVTAFVGGL